MKASKSVIELGKSQYLSAVGADNMKRDEDGFIVLTPTAKRVDEQVNDLTTNISSLEAKLEKFKQEKRKAIEYQKTPEYTESKKKEKNKKFKKQKQNLLEMVFNNADHDAEEEKEIDEEDAENYRDSKKKRKKESTTTLETTYGKRFTPVVSMLHDTIHEFDKIASSIQDELNSPQLKGRSMYRSSQISNLISAKNSKLSAVKELASVATTISNLEYKKEKDKKAEEGSDTSKAISSLGAKFLRGGFETNEDRKAKKDRKKKKSFMDDDDDDVGSIKKASSGKRDSDDDDDDRELAAKLAKALGARKGDFSFTPAEKFMNMEGKYNIVVVADEDDPKDDWKFIAVDPKSGKEIPDFKDDYPGLLPKKKNCRMSFDLSRLRVYDKNSGRTYKLLLK